MLRLTLATAMLAALAMLAAPLAARAQDAPFGAHCRAAAGSPREHCYRLVEAVHILGPRTSLVLAGGNPVAGTASTLGMRVGSSPRVSFGVRVNGLGVELPGLAGADAPQLAYTALGASLDVAVGVFNGLTLGSTVGGFGALDLVGSVGRTGFPSGEGFRGAVNSWAAGGRLGLLRESFTAPGISVTTMYRRVGDLRWMGTERNPTPHFEVRELANLSVRAAASKRLAGLGFTAGAGWDRYEFGGSVELAGDGTWPVLSLRDDHLESSRTTFFASAAYTMLVLHAVAEAGWQAGGSSSPDIPDSGRLGAGAFYGSLALRLVY